MLMKNLLYSKEYWSVIGEGVSEISQTTTPTHIKIIEEPNLKDLNTENYLFQTINRGIIQTILNKDMTKEFDHGF